MGIARDYLARIISLLWFVISKTLEECANANWLQVEPRLREEAVKAFTARSTYFFDESDRFSNWSANGNAYDATVSF